MSSYCPDVNVWIALTYRGHQHHLSANSWFATLDDETAYFCRLTQLDAAQLEFTLRRLSSSTLASSQQWPDAYLAAFANTSALTLVTFDRALSRRAPGTVLLLS